MLLVVSIDYSRAYDEYSEYEYSEYEYSEYEYNEYDDDNYKSNYSGYPSFRKLRWQVLIPRCVRCHIGFLSKKFVDRRVVPGEPEDSKLYKMVITDRMPKKGRKLYPREKDLIYDYIMGLKY